jgi:hypothetical protein
VSIALTALFTRPQTTKFTYAKEILGITMRAMRQMRQMLQWYLDLSKFAQLKPDPSLSSVSLGENSSASLERAR